MSNIVEFALRMRDMASQSLRQFGTTASRTFTQATQLTNNLSTHNRVLGQSYDQLRERMRQLENTVRTSTIPSQIRAARQELERLQRQADRHQGNTSRLSAESSSGSGGMMGLVKGAGIAVAAYETAHRAADFIGESINKGLERQQIQTSFNVLAGSDQKGSALTSQLVALQRDTILGSEVFKNAQTMMGFGFKSDEVYKNLKMLGDVSMGDADKLQALTLAFSQSKAAGKLMGQDLLQYINAGFNPLQVISEKTGKSIGKLKDDMEKGKIPFSMIEQAFKDATSEGGRFNNMLAKIAETPAGKVQQLSGEWAEFKVQLGATFMPVISQILDLAERLMPSLTSSLSVVSSFANKIVGVISQLTDGGWNDYLQIVQNHFEAIRGYTSEIFDKISKSVNATIRMIRETQFLKDLFSALWDNLDDVLWAVNEIAGVIRDFVADMKTMVGYIDKTYTWMKGNASRFSKEGAGLNPNATSVPAALTNNLFGQNQLMIQNPVAPKSTEKMPLPMTPDKVQQQNSQLLGQIATNTKTNADNSSSTEKSITSGGPKIINISVGKFLDSINIHANTITESTNEMEQKILEMFSRVLAQGATTPQ